MFHKEFHLDMGHILLILALLAILVMAVKKSKVSFGLCTCPGSGRIEGMSGMPDLAEMRYRVDNADIEGYVPSDYGVTAL